VVFEAIGDDKVRATASSWTGAVVIRANEALERSGLRAFSPGLDF
jgi:hypothetical protein